MHRLNIKETTYLHLELYSHGIVLTPTGTWSDGVSAPDDIEAEGTSVLLQYDSASRALTWTGTPADGQQAIIRYKVVILTGERRLLANTAEPQELGSESRTASATVFADPLLSCLPVTGKAR